MSAQADKGRSLCHLLRLSHQPLQGSVSNSGQESSDSRAHKTNYRMRSTEPRPCSTVPKRTDIVTCLRNCMTLPPHTSPSSSKSAGSWKLLETRLYFRIFTN